MPIYEYACRDCGQKFEALVRHDNTPECPACHSHGLDKQLSVFAAVGERQRDAAPPAWPAGPCGTCGHPDGPGSCAVH